MLVLQDGSFYQYFESKEDLLEYILKKHTDEMEEKIEKTLLENNGDIFALFISMYDYMIKECVNKGEEEFYKKIFENIKTSEESLFSSNIEKYKPPHDIERYINLINTSNLNIKEKDDIKTISRILFAITKKAIVFNFKYESKEKAKKEFLKELEFLKYGICKRKGEEKC